jgi:mannose-6-phosphate isomerase class I
MELSERSIQTLEKEGFTSIYEESRTPGQVFYIKSTESPLVIFVTEGSLLISIGNEIKELLPGNRYNVPPNTSLVATAGTQGCQYVIGEM